MRARHPACAEPTPGSFRQVATIWVLTASSSAMARTAGAVSSGSLQGLWPLGVADDHGNTHAPAEFDVRVGDVLLDDHNLNVLVA
jgi:hypothetical protein